MKKKQEITVMDYTKNWRHGDVNGIPIQNTSLKQIPKEAVITKDNVVEHGESGHSHKIQNGQILMLKEPIEIETSIGTQQVEKFLHLEQDTVISHEEHLPLTLQKGDYVIVQEREMDHLAEVERNVLD